MLTVLFVGVILLPDPYSDNPASRVRPWYAEVRGIYSANNGYITITGLGVVSCRNTLYAPLESDSSYFDTDFEALKGWRLCEPSESWCFGFHNSCWRLLLLRLDRAYDDSFQNEKQMVFAESIFHQLYCTPCLEASSFRWGHDYEGAAQTHKTIGRVNVDLSSHFYADPCATPPTDDLEATTTAVGIDYHSEGGTSASPDITKVKRLENVESPKNDIFNGLSPELKVEIFSYLPFEELLNLRLVCRGLALLANIDTLPQSYWQSRFLLGQEADFLFPSLINTQDWSQLFFRTRASLRAGALSLIS